MATTTIKSVGSASAGEVSRIAVQAFSNSEVLTAVRTGSGRLMLIGWLTPDGENIIRAADSDDQAGAVSEIALTLVGRRAVTAVRTGSGRLMLISWDVPSQMGRVTRLKDTGPLDAATQIAMIPIPGGRALITAFRTGSGNLKLISWGLLGDGRFTQLGDSGNQAGEVSLIAASPLESDRNIFVTAVRTGSGRLMLITWDVSEDGKIIARKGDSGDQAGAVGEIAMVHTRDNFETLQSGVLTAVQTDSGNLMVIEWRIRANGELIERRSEKEAGTASCIAIASAGFPPIYLTSMRKGTGDLELIAFDLSGDFGAVTRTGDFGPNIGTDITETAVTSLGGERAVTAIRNGDFLHVGTWTIETPPISGF
jgi:hypothetical protein